MSRLRISAFVGVLEEEVANLDSAVLTVAVEASHALIDSSWRPWKVEVHHDVGKLEVQALLSCICRNHYTFFVLGSISEMNSLSTFRSCSISPSPENQVFQSRKSFPIAVSEDPL